MSNLSYFGVYVFDLPNVCVCVARSVVAGVMWMTYDGGFNIRHTCEHGDGLQSFGWLKHDGISFGQQDIFDNG